MSVLSSFVLFNRFRMKNCCFCTRMPLSGYFKFLYSCVKEGWVVLHTHLITTFLIYIGDQTLMGLGTECISKGRDFSKEESVAFRTLAVVLYYLSPVEENIMKDEHFRCAQI